MTTIAAPPTAIHHIALTVTDLAVSRRWYRQILGADPVLDEDVPPLPGHHDGFHHTLFALSGGTILALHTHSGTDPADRSDERRCGLDHLAFPCRDRDEVRAWAAQLDRLGIAHAPIADDALGHGLAVRDPDGIALEFWAPRD